MPPHTSHLLQPLDVGVFGPLKRAYGKLVEEMMVARNNHIDKQDLLSLYPTARERVFIRENIYGDFAGAGLKPLDKERVLAKITFQLHTPTPPPSLVEGCGGLAHSPLRSKHLKTLTSWITSSTAYRGVLTRRDSYLVSQDLIFNILRRLCKRQ